MKHKISINNKTGDRIIPPAISHSLILQRITLSLPSTQTSQDGVFQTYIRKHKNGSINTSSKAKDNTCSDTNCKNPQTCFYTK